MCVPAARFDDEEDEEDEPEENKRKDEFDFSMQGATTWLSSTYQATSLSDRDSRGDPDQISTCPHCHLALPLLTLRWHKVTFLHHTRFVYTWLKCSHGNSPPSLCVFRWSAESTFSWNKERELLRMDKLPQTYLIHVSWAKGRETSIWAVEMQFYY